MRWTETRQLTARLPQSRKAVARTGDHHAPLNLQKMPLKKQSKDVRLLYMLRFNVHLGVCIFIVLLHHRGFKVAGGASLALQVLASVVKMQERLEMNLNADVVVSLP